MGIPEQYGAISALASSANRFVAFLIACRQDCGLSDTFAEFQMELTALATIVEAFQSDPTAVGYPLPAAGTIPT